MPSICGSPSNCCTYFLLVLPTDSTLSLQTMHVMLFQTLCLDCLVFCSSSVDGGESVDAMEDVTEDMELEQLHNDSAYESFSSQGSV